MPGAVMIHPDVPAYLKCSANRSLPRYPEVNSAERMQKNNGVSWERRLLQNCANVPEGRTPKDILALQH
jgi:hypothetical protein